MNNTERFNAGKFEEKDRELIEKLLNMIPESFTPTSISDKIFSEYPKVKLDSNDFSEVDK